ncbi:hypothetical protein A3D11_00600 [Candidatus Peribacteria bacterium RIFCSPHIGHO2_02_FULL_49_16]|nr:MAG: hypothetical protein A2880_03560 [Candidatus Peribacteria bacterium RIFCSPHIGHO2_01_FULL_49_38]OGJ59486.1 MAG: hypothetical protein A3D11_00600 [Candidatus Peribacteria bacterium RIFCSPHIGHO2_02_FULL_49_16]
MRKLSILFSALGGAAAAYLVSNKKLRAELSKAKTTDDVGKILGKHLQQDGKKLGKDICDFLESDRVQNKIKQANVTAQKHFDIAEKEVRTWLQKGKKEVVKQAGSAAKSMKKTVKKRTRNAFKIKQV